ncbi:MAG: tetratricopeptide repeat protein [Candidatus Latescibacteria bacterium]|nr:tetratricopeptide repeat protein [bacterium]MBD3423312.1 tetratricopeptide repeat protein [Candidatus Latescibacterota bacterium]
MTTIERIKRYTISVMLLTPVLVVAFCNPVSGEVLQDITDSNIRSYINSQLRTNPPELNVVSGVLTREAEIALDKGETDQAVKLLKVAADISSSNPEPSLLLARIELMRANPGFLLHLIDAARIETGSFYKSAIFSVNMYIIFLSSAGLALALYLLALAVKYNGEIFHKTEEVFSGRFKLPPAKYLGLSALAAMLLLRPGFAILIILLSAITWRFISRKEKTVISSLVVLLAIASLFSGRMNRYGPALDEESITRKLSMINEAGGTDDLVRRIRGINRPEFSAEKNFALGTLMYRRGNLSASSEYLKRSLAERKDFIPAYINLGNVYFMRNDFDKALAGYRNATGLDSTSAIAHYNIGQTCIQKMHFNLSSTALKKARRFGIDRYKSENPVVKLKNPEVLTCGFRKSDLENISARESGMENFSILDLVFRNLIFVPVGSLWFLLPAGILLGVIISRAVPQRWGIFHCDNCGQPVCSECVDTGRGLNLCQECKSVVEGLSSVKVMEALLRRRRQNKSAGMVSGKLRALRIIPGGAHMLSNRVISGIVTATIFSLSVNLLLRNGLYFKDPRFSLQPDSIWRIVAPLMVIVLSYVISFRVRKPEAERRYYILPQEMQDMARENQDGEKRAEEQGQAEEIITGPTGQAVEDPFGTFIDSV